MLIEHTVMRADGFRVVEILETDAHGWLTDLWYELVDERVVHGPFPTCKAASAQAAELRNSPPRTSVD